MVKRIICTENQADRLHGVIVENRESKNLSKARNYIRKMRPNIDAQQIVDGIRTDIPNSRIADCKFILGIARMYLDGQLQNQDIIAKLNRTLRLIGSDAHVNEYNNDLNGESADVLIQRFSGNIQQDLDNRKNDLSRQTFQDNGEYEIVPIDSFEEAEKYGEYTSWCVTHYPEMYNSYTHSGMGRFYFCLKNGFESVPQEKGENCPLDEYGLSMIAVSVNEDGSCNTITCRWNHDNGGNDNIMDEEELSRVIGRNFYQTFLPYSPQEIEERKKNVISQFCFVAKEFINFYYDDPLFKNSCVYFYNEDYDDDASVFYDEDEATYPKLFILNSSDMSDLLEDVGDERYMIFNNDYNPICQEIFDNVEIMSEQKTYNFTDEVFFRVQKNDKYNILRGDGKFIGEWAKKIMSVPGSSVKFMFFFDYSDIAIIDGHNFSETPHFSGYMYLYGTRGFFWFDNKNTYKYMDIKRGDVILDNIVNLKKFSPDIYAIKFADKDGYFLYRIFYGRVIKLSNIPFVNGLGWVNDYYSILSVNGDKLFVDAKRSRTYDENNNLVDQVNESRIDLIIKNVINEIKDKLYL